MHRLRSSCHQPSSWQARTNVLAGVSLSRNAKWRLLVKIPQVIMSKIAYVPSIVVCLSQITQFTSSERNLLQVATTETEVAESVSPNPHRREAHPQSHETRRSQNIQRFVVTSVSFRLTASPDTVNRASANGALSTLMLNDLDQLFSLIL